MERKKNGGYTHHRIKTMGDFEPSKLNTIDATITTVRRKPRLLKQIFESDYVQPTENNRVI